MSAATSSLQADDDELTHLVSTGAAQLGFSLDEPQVRRYVVYVRLIERWNVAYNITAIRDPRLMVTHHILDCLAAADALIRRRGEGAGDRLVDVGSGAGLPGLVIAMASPERDVTCVDSVGKKAAFMAQAAGILALNNVRVLHARIEDLVGRFDVVSSRAFASLGEFVNSTGHLLTQPGTWMAMKGKTPHRDELNGLQPGSTFHVEPLTVPGLDAERCIVWVQKPVEGSARL